MTKREMYEAFNPIHRVGLCHRNAVNRAIGQLVAALRRAGVSYEEGSDPMADVERIIITFMGAGVFRDPDIMIAGSHDVAGATTTLRVSGCPVGICFDPRPDEENTEIGGAL